VETSVYPGLNRQRRSVARAADISVVPVEVAAMVTMVAFTPKLMPTNVRNRASKSDFNDDLEGKVCGAARSLASSHGFDLQLPLRIQQPATYYG
jgi:hypothetical protein